mmetsp:Transcript_24320/g.79342  ORF Transcript_24320/g.79342 Transcript_24320/m.79342 type:complete len:258 (-) Transcript_24320:512-1285(-)
MSSMRHISTAMARWSPVIILTATPNSFALCTVCLVSGRGGSRKVSMPSMYHPPVAPSARATASERMPRTARSCTLAAMASSTSALFSSMSNSTLGAPLVTRTRLPSGLLMVASVRLTVGSNGTKSSCLKPARRLVSTALRTSVSRASRGGSHHLAAMAALMRTSSRVTPAVKMGRSSWSSILLRVRVPVLSLHKMVMPASSSMDERRATIAFSCASSWQPSASVVVHTTRMAIGMEAMRMMTQKLSTSRTGSPSTMR